MNKSQIYLHCKGVFIEVCEWESIETIDISSKELDIILMTYLIDLHHGLYTGTSHTDNVKLFEELFRFVRDIPLIRRDSDIRIEVLGPLNWSCCSLITIKKKKKKNRLVHG